MPQKTPAIDRIVWAKMWLVACLVALYGVHSGQGLQTIPINLQADQVHVVATAECGDGEQYVACAPAGSDCLRTCGEKRGIPHGAELSVDGDKGTSWQSPTRQFYASMGEPVPAATLIIDLGQASYPSLAPALQETVFFVGGACCRG